MSLTNFPNGISSFGIPQLGGGGNLIPQTTGSYFFVDSNTGDDAGNEATFSKPVATIDAAINKCTASKGDVIIVMPGHAETIADATSLVPDVAGITIVGLGNRFNRPTITYSATGSEIIVTAENVTFRNLIFQAGVSAVATAIDVNANNVNIEQCLFYYGGTTTYDFVLSVDIDAFDNTVITDCEFYAEAATAGSSGAIRIDDANYITIQRNWFHGNYSDSAIANIAADALGIGLLITDNEIYNDDTAGVSNSIELANACTGLIARNCCAGLEAGSAVLNIDPGSCLLCQNFGVNAINEVDVACGSGTAST